MSEMSPARAIEIVARQVIHNATSDWGRCDWEDYPEIGEDDWFKILKEIADLAPHVARDEFAAAYDLLKARAER
jgi:hypothetical protein